MAIRYLQGRTFIGCDYWESDPEVGASSRCGQPAAEVVLAESDDEQISTYAAWAACADHVAWAHEVADTTLSGDEYVIVSIPPGRTLDEDEGLLKVPDSTRRRLDRRPRSRRGEVKKTDEHVILVAFTVEALDRPAAEQILTERLPDAGGSLTSWWVAEDDRRDRSDNDSAVFCDKGAQREATETLVAARFSGAWNLARSFQRLSALEEDR